MKMEDIAEKRMKKIAPIVLIVLLSSCFSNSKKEVTGAQRYIDVIEGFSCEKAAVTENGYLVVAIDAMGGNYDFLASQFLDEAKKEGVTGLNGVFIVDIKDCQFSDGTVIGNRIGKAFNRD